MVTWFVVPRFRCTVGRQALSRACDRKEWLGLMHVSTRKNCAGLSVRIPKALAHATCPDAVIGQGGPSWRRFKKCRGFSNGFIWRLQANGNRCLTQQARFSGIAQEKTNTERQRLNDDTEPRRNLHDARSEGMAKRDGETQPLPKALRAQLETISKLYRRAEISNAALFGGVTVIVVGAGVIYMNWHYVRQHVSKESAGMVAETIRDKQLQDDAQQFSKALLNHLLTDEEVARTVARWTYGVLQSLKNEIGDLFVHILALEQVVAAVNRLADRLVEYLCSSRTIQERVGKLLVDAICLESSRDAAAQWAVDLVMREDVKHGFRDLVVAALQTDAVVQEARGLAIIIVNSVLNDPNTQNEARRALNDTLRDSALRAAAKDSLWSIVLPWGSKPTDKPAQKALKSLEDVLALEMLTPEEKHVLLSLQNRLRSEAPTRNPSKNVSIDAVANSPDAARPTEAQPSKEKGEVERVSLEQEKLAQETKEKLMAEAAKKAEEERLIKEKADREAKDEADRRIAEEASAKKVAEEKIAREKAEQEAEAVKKAAEQAAKEKAAREVEEAAKKAAEEAAKKAVEEKLAREKVKQEEAARKAAEEQAAQEKIEREAEEAARSAAKAEVERKEAEEKLREAEETAKKASEEQAAKERAELQAEVSRKIAEEEVVARKLAEEKAMKDKADEEAVLEAARRAKEKSEREEAEEKKAAADKLIALDIARKIADEAAEQSALAREAEKRAAALKGSSEETAAKEYAEQTALAREAEERATALKEMAEEAAKEAVEKCTEKDAEETAHKTPEMPEHSTRLRRLAQVVKGVVDPFIAERKGGDDES